MLLGATVAPISLARLALLVLPLCLVLVFFVRFGLDIKRPGLAVARMLGQLLIIGYFLSYVFEATSSWPVLVVLGVMVVASSWIGLGSVEARRSALFRKALIAIAMGGGLNLVLVTFGVLGLDPWYEPSTVIPLAGMIFAGSMNSVSLSAERFYSERSGGAALADALRTAYNAALIPILNSFFAVGLVMIPGMMTGQILSGVEPLVAARYQILVMGMLLGAQGISAALFLFSIARTEDTV